VPNIKSLARRSHVRLADGEYEGGWEGDEPSGHGILRWDNGNEYEGAWLKGPKHGRGVLRWASGAVGPGRYRPPRHQTPFIPSFLEANGIL